MTSNEIKKIIEKNFESIIPENFRIKNNIFYYVPIIDFVKGFCFEKSKNEENSLYVWSFVQPLFVPNDTISLSFGKRLGNRLWTLKGNDVIQSDIIDLSILMKNEVVNFFADIDSNNKFYNFYENECKNIRMVEALVYSAIYSQNKNAELILNNFINNLQNEDLSIKWIGTILQKMQHLKLILNDKDKLDTLFKANIKYTKVNIGL